MSGSRSWFTCRLLRLLLRERSCPACCQCSASLSASASSSRRSRLASDPAVNASVGRTIRVRIDGRPQAYTILCVAVEFGALHSYVHFCAFHPGLDWEWDNHFKSSGALLSCGNRKVSFHLDYSSGTAAIRGSKELTDGQHFWEVKMTSPVYGTDMVGVK